MSAPPGEAAPGNGSSPAVASSEPQVPPQPDAQPAFSGAPEPEFEIVGAAPVPRSVAPTMRFEGRITTTPDRPVYAVALSAMLSVEPAKRSYSDAERERLAELFGTPERWASTTGAFRWAQVDAVVPGYTGVGEFTLDVACTYDLELASGKYFGSLDDGPVPLRIDFNGSVFYEAGDGRIQIVLIPWDRSVRFELPMATWREMIESHHPNRGWIPLSTDTLARLRRLKSEHGSPTFDAAVTDLLDADGEENA